MFQRFAVAVAVVIGLVAYQNKSPRILQVGPGQQYEEIHHLPKLEAGDRIFVHWREAPYATKLTINVSDVYVECVPGPQGQSATLTAVNATENAGVAYFTDQIASQGLITIAPAAKDSPVNNVIVQGLRIRECRAGGEFTRAGGEKAAFNEAASGVALYRCTNVAIRANSILGNDNGIFGRSYGEAGGDLRDIIVEWNNFGDNGVSGSDRFHNSYIEGIGVVYQFNHYWAPTSGSSGCNLKDRSAGAVIRYNRFEGGAVLMDLVDPEADGPTVVSDKAFGQTHVYGNLLVNPTSGGSAGLVHFGFDGMAKNAQRVLNFYSNTVINEWQKIPATWYTYLFRSNGAQDIRVANNIIHGIGSNPNEFRMIHDEGGGTKISMKSNWVSGWAAPGDVQIDGWMDQLRGRDPGFVNGGVLDVDLKANSPCRRRAASLQSLGWGELKPVDFTYVPTSFNWVHRLRTVNMGAVELFGPSGPGPGPVTPPVEDVNHSRQVGFTEMQDTGIAEIMQGWKKEVGDWWPWGLVSFDYDRDGDQDLLVQLHSGGSIILRNDGGKFVRANVGSTLGSTYRPRVIDVNNDGYPDLVYADSSRSNSVWINRKGVTFEPMGYQIGNGTPLSVGVTIADLNGDGFTDIQAPISGSPGNAIRYIYNPVTQSFNAISYTHPLIRTGWGAAVVNEEWKKAPQHFSAWVTEGYYGNPTVITGFAAYGGSMFSRYSIDRQDKTESLGLPTYGACCHIGDFNRDGKSDFIIVGAGLYLSGPDGKYSLKPGPLTDFVKTPGPYIHRVIQTDFAKKGRNADLVVWNPRWGDTRVFQGDGFGEFKEVLKVGSWDGDPVAVCDINGDGLQDICIGSGDSVRIFLNATLIPKSPSTR